MSASASIRSIQARATAAVRRLGDVLGLGTAGTVAVVVAVVALLGALLWSGQLVAAVLVLLVVVAAMVVVVVRVLQPVRAVTRDVHRAAHETLPALAAALEAGGPATGPEVASPEATTRTPGPAEVVALADAVTSLRTTATSLAVQEHHRHRRTSDLTTHLARRNHGLVDRLVTQIGELETAERSPAVQAQLSRLKHTATRTRRHAESMLVLTGSLPDRSRPRPSAVTEVVRGALAGIEDHARVKADAVEPAAVSGSVVADLAHLVAELVENATHFSPPETRVRITGASDGDGFRVRVVDHGVGMTSAQLDAANERIRTAPGKQAQQTAKLVGLDVVGRLAARHGITVTLERGGSEGVIATVALPGRLLVPLSDLPAPRRPVSALVAAAAFRPPLASDAEPPPVVVERARQRKKKKPDPASAELVRPGVPRRVRGAQLPDLGPDRKDGPHVTPDAGRVHGRLNALQAGLSAARTDNIPPLPQELPEPAPGRTSDGDD
jgi:signal transduction histidine kinase